MYKELIEHNQYAMHMPGHKRNPKFQMVNPYEIDMTEIEGMDNLHHPQGMILDCMNRIKQQYKTKKTYILVGGSTCGLLAGISACCRRGDTVLVDRGCHRSVYHAIYLLGCKPVYLLPEVESEYGFSLGVSASEVEKKLAAAQGKAAAAIITSPTYEGVVSNIRDIAKILHREGIPLIVDEAHGAHLSWMQGRVKGTPESAAAQGADLVVQSLHKTLPALTQTALLHLCSERVSPEQIERYLDIYETSSPSYVLMASVDCCMTYLSQNGKERFAEYAEMLREFRHRASAWQSLKLWEHPAKEPSKLVIGTGSELTGPELSGILREKYGFAVEMEAAGYILAMTSLADERSAIIRFAEALTEIDAVLTKKRQADTGDAQGTRHDSGTQGTHPDDDAQRSWQEPQVCMDAYDAVNQPYEEVVFLESVNRISAEYVMVYPPGIPFLVPGERVTEEAVRKMTAAKEKNLPLLGLADKKTEKIRVIKKRGLDSPMLSD